MCSASNVFQDTIFEFPQANKYKDTPIFLRNIVRKMGIDINMSSDLRIPHKGVLIVDSDINLRHSLALILKRAGYSVTSVGQACEALDFLETVNYNLVILDIVMEDNKQILLPTILRQYPNTSVLVFTARWSPETAAEIKELGVSAHLEKPVTPNALLECVRTII